MHVILLFPYEFMFLTGEVVEVSYTKINKFIWITLFIQCMHPYYDNMLFTNKQDQIGNQIYVMITIKV